MTDGEGLLHPEVVVSSAEVIGNITAWQLPYNVQNVIGNWLMLIGQVIITFNAQQQYLMSGAGPCFGEALANPAATEIEDTTKRLQELERQVALLRARLGE